MIKVLIVDDSPVAQEFLTYIFTSDPDIRVVGVAANGLEAIKAAVQVQPDIITMDIHMPIMDGFEATRRIMEIAPKPIIIISGSSGCTEVASTFRAIEAGALAVVLRPAGINHEEFETSAREIVRTIKLMAEIKVVKRIQRTTGEHPPVPSPIMQAPGVPTKIQVVAIGASTGGPPVLREILSDVPHDLPFPVLIVQHIASGFTKGFAEWLTDASGFPVSIASHDEVPLPGHVYIPPDGFHMGVREGPRIVLSDHAPENGIRPSVAYLFCSVAQVFGPSAVGVLLTGMGKDGAEELKMMKDKGAITFAQDEASSVVHGMPGEAIRLGAATYVFPPATIAATLVVLVKKMNEKPQ
jgi:two-component system chemotaxis response regulator CheB